MKLLTTFATIFILGSFAIPTSTLAQTDEDNAAANALFVEAARTYTEANATSGRERIELLREVASTLNLISEQYPGTLPASRIEERNLGSIDLAAIEAAVDPQGYEAIPLQVATAIELTAERACGEAGTTSCKSELSEALVEYIAVLAFDLDRASDVEQLSWLFSNPGQFDGNLARVNAFSDLLEDNAFRDNFIERVNRRVISDMAVEATADLAFSLLTGVVSETLAQHYESQGYDEAAEFTRTWMEPIVDASLVLEGASTASAAGAGVGATIVWAKNVYAFWQLGEKQYRAEQTGATADQQLELLAAEIDSYTRTLISGRLTGVAFEGSEGAPLTDRHAEVIKSVLEQHYELQQYWLNSDHVVVLEAFDAVLNLARAFYETLGRLSEPTPLDAADGAGALPTDLQGLGLQPAPDGFLGLPTIPTTTSETGEGLIGHWMHRDLVAMSEVSDSGVPACTIVGDGLAWQITPERISFYESSCSFPSPLAADQTVYSGIMACSGEGQNWSEAVNIERLGKNLTYYSNDHVQELVACTPPVSATANGDVVWGIVENDAEQEMVASPDIAGAVAPVGSSRLTISAGFFDPRYTTSWNPPAQHIGIDLPASEGTQIKSPVAGIVLLNRTERIDPFQKYLIVRSAEDGYEHVFGHINSPLAEGDTVGVGTPLGTIILAGTGPHVHWGINTNGILEALGSGWGWGRAPLTATVEQAADRGWIDPGIWFENKLATMGQGEASEADTPPSPVVASGSLYGCRPSASPNFPQAMLPGRDAPSVILGQTVSGNEWSLRLYLPGSHMAGAEFTNSAGTVVDGFWRSTATGLCQSYNGRQSWSCHDVLVCEGETDRFVMRNEDGELSSIVRVGTADSIRSMGGTTAQSPDAQPPPGNFVTPGGTMWVQLASLDNEAAAVDTALNLKPTIDRIEFFQGVSVFQTISGSYVVTAGRLFETVYGDFEQLRMQGIIPANSSLNGGEDFLREVLLTETGTTPVNTTSAVNGLNESLPTCANIVDNIARLECFDQTGAVSDRGERDIYTVLQEYRDLVQQTDDPFSLFKVGSVTDNDLCSLNASHVFVGRNLFNVRGFQFEEVTIDLSAVERLEGLKSTSSRGTGIDVIFERGKEGYWSTAWTAPAEPLVDQPDFDIANIDPWSLGSQKFFQDRSVTFLLVPADFNEDRERALLLLRELHQLCRFGE